MSDRIIMLGTGHAMVTKCYNTCFLLDNEEEYLLVDAGGGNQILSQLEKAEVNIGDIHYMFVTHSHTDHVLGVVWVIRKISTLMKQGRYDGDFVVFCHDECRDTIMTLCQLTLMAKQFQMIGERIFIDEVKSEEVLELPGMKLEFFDIGSTKKKQFGFCAEFASGKTVTCLGDEPYRDICEKYVRDCDWLLCEAFCLYEERDKFKPYEKRHSTVKDAAEIAEELGVKNVVMYHTEDSHIRNRKLLYTQEAQRYFNGGIYVPDDLDEIMI